MDNATPEAIHYASFVCLVFTTHKNEIIGEILGHSHSGDPT